MDTQIALDEQFLAHLSTINRTEHLRGHPALSSADWIQVYRAQVESRLLDFQARALKAKNEGFYTIGSSGHEANALMGYLLPVESTSYLHYRSGAYMLARAKKMGYPNMLEDILASMMCLEQDPISSGRHKVFGSHLLSVPPQTSTIASHLPKAVGSAFGMTKRKNRESRMVLCSFGDASVNHASAQSAFNTAQWLAHQHIPLPLLMVCENNGLGISVPSPTGWVKKVLERYSDCPVITVDSWNLNELVSGVLEAVTLAIGGTPVFLQLDCVRLMGHAGSDIESSYRSEQAIQKDIQRDPLLATAEHLVNIQAASPDELQDIYRETKEVIEREASRLTGRSRLADAKAVMSSLIPPRRTHQSTQDKRARLEVFGQLSKLLDSPRTLSAQLNYTLIDLMRSDDKIMVFGEDVALKGGVYGVTQGLLERFGNTRVFDTLLDETTILGFAMGLASQGYVPIAEIQFLAYLHNAIDQLRGEAATMSFFSNGQYTNPMLIRIPSFAYQKGIGGHFHNENSISSLLDIPGLIIAAPSNGRDASGMLRECYRLVSEEQRVVVFLEPIALYGVKDLHQKGDKGWMSLYDEKAHVPFGQVGTYGESDAPYVIVSYGNGYYFSRQAQALLASHDIHVRVLDIRWLSPLPIERIAQNLEGARGVLLVDECRESVNISQIILSKLMQRESSGPIMTSIHAKDTFIPLGPSMSTVLPSVDEIVSGMQALVTRSELNG